jgi:hypothetical protein
MINTRFYQRGNASYTAYGDTFRLWVVAAFAWIMRVQIKVEGLPFGGAYKIPSKGNMRPEETADPLK